MLSRSESRKSGNISSGSGTLRRRLQGDPFVRKRAVRYISIIDQGIAGLLSLYAAYRLINYDFKNQSLIVLIGANENVFVAMIYWLTVFTLIGLQLVIAFLLLTATKDMTTDPETMIKKCRFWRTFSLLLLVCLFSDFIISIYIFFAIDNELQRLVSVSLDAGEGIFRLFGVIIVGKFIDDLHSIFAKPMTTLSASSSPVLPQKSISRTSSMNAGDHLRGSSGTPSCSRTHSMNAKGEEYRPTSSMSIDIVPKFSRTPSICISNRDKERPPLSRTTSFGVSDGSVGRGSRNSDGAVILNIASSSVGEDEVFKS